jgi:glycolate oxidase
LFDSRDPADRAKVMAAGMEVLRVCAELRGTVSGEHGIGVEKLDALPLVFTDDDLRAQGFVKEAFDPRGQANPGKALRRIGQAPGVPTHDQAEVPAGV